MNDRLMHDTSTGKNVDEHLEIVFSEVYHENISDPAAITTLINPYTSAIYGDAAVPFEPALTSIEHAIKWATQFGELRIIPVTGVMAREILKDDTRECNWIAKIGDDRPDQSRVYGRTLIQVIVLAGVQVLRETAHGLLNSPASKH